MLGLPGLGVPELLLLLALALVIFGPGKLPGTARAIRRAIDEFKQVSNGQKTEADERSGPHDG